MSITSFINNELFIYFIVVHSNNLTILFNIIIILTFFWKNIIRNTNFGAHHKVKKKQA